MSKKKVYSFGLGSILFLFFIYFFISNYPGLPAQVADSILRPIIGSKKTIALESVYFSLHDQINKLTYKYKKPNANIFTLPEIHSASADNTLKSETMGLQPITLTNSFPRLTSEGIWQTISNRLFSKQTVLAKTFIRPDSTRDYVIVSLVKMNMKKLSIGLQGGTYYPGGEYGVYGSGRVPRVVQQTNSLVAAFNGGFMARDGHYGMVLDNNTYVPLKQKLATFVIFADGTAKIIYYHGQKLGNSVVGMRQNGAFLVKDEIITSFVENSKDTWGRTTTNSMYTWRSGIGITKNGNLIYAVGNSLVPQTLAKALKAAGALNAMQLDINPYWVRYILYDNIGNGRYSYYPLLTDMHNGGHAYLHGYNKDFFYIYKKSST